MNAKNLILGLSVAAIGLSSCCNTSTKTNVSLKNEAVLTSLETVLKTSTWTLSSPE